jgi:hypothetical protein
MTEWIVSRGECWVWLGPDHKVLQPPLYRGETIVGFQRARDGTRNYKDYFSASDWPQRALWLVIDREAPREVWEGDKPKETTDADGETVIGYVEERYVDCGQRFRGRCPFGDHYKTIYDFKNVCFERKRIMLRSCRWGRCLFCGKGGKIGGRVIASGPFMLAVHRWGTSTKQTLADEADFELDDDDRYICHGCNRRLDNLYNHFMDCNDLINKIRDYRPDAETTNDHTADAASDHDQDDARSAAVATSNL